MAGYQTEARRRLRAYLSDDDRCDQFLSSLGALLQATYNGVSPHCDLDKEHVRRIVDTRKALWALVDDCQESLDY